MEAICKYCELQQPDVICFQEVIPEIMPFLCEQQWIKSGYILSDYSGTTVDPYGVLILVKTSLRPSFNFIALPSRMGRVLLTTEIYPNPEDLDQNFMVATVHLESLSSHRTRVQQLTIANIALLSENSILCGDFNFCSYRNFDAPLPLENDSLRITLPDYADVWELLHPESIQPTEGYQPPTLRDIRRGKLVVPEIPSAGYTFDSIANKMLQRDWERMRYDRIMIKNSSDWKPLQIVGTEKIGLMDWGISLFPSDHFGLLATFTKSAKNSRRTAP